MKSDFFSIDIETLGLGLHAPIIQFACVHADWLTGEIHDELEVLVRHKEYNNCEPYAMSMHPQLLRAIAVPEPTRLYVAIEDLAEAFHDWLPNRYQHGPKIVVAGKNVASFDLPRLSAQAPYWDTMIKTHHRVLDPAMLYWNPCEDEVPPGSDDCLARAGIDSETQHTALDDARDVVQMIFRAVGRMSSPIQLAEAIRERQ